MSILTLVKTKAEFSMITVLKLKTKLKTRGASVCLIKSRVKNTHRQDLALSKFYFINTITNEKYILVIPLNQP